MRYTPILALLIGALSLSACGQRDGSADVDRALKDLNVVDESNLNGLMLAQSDPNEAVAYFRRATSENPKRMDLQRGLAKALIRAKQPNQAAPIFARVAESKDGTDEDRLALADALIRAGDWKAAEVQIDKVPPSVQTYQRFRLEAMIADSNKEWDAADSFYQSAAGLTQTPAGVFNNWGYSKLTRGKFTEAERLFTQALTHDSDLFTAKNNMALARGAQGNYELPVVDMTQEERALLLHTLALTAIKQGNVATGEGLLRDAIDTHPQHFAAAQRALDALASNVSNG
ncbi:Tetratricopeptide repeat protein [Rhodobacteraceae bacterium THAF1]|uniref:tetratricopeptide repeat protein n=1 Tax=Palleronia sp. THAF1 TaxID=2587842 RepID=UPI000F3FC2B6|nr:tetratricopeptide repeat protein [Palleronia sp. THAF1]QFU07400.1 Tetratricopeptide repeat protein [Palleronia sp. THAF1]VDC20688.1 Tetratricopeptide repeat protein [Rhodobacteraceae bacterium THAF1]